MAFDAGSVTAELILDRSPFISSLNAARLAAAEFASKTYSATIGAHTQPFRQAAAAVQDRAERLSRLNPRPTVGLETQPFRVAAAAVTDRVQRLDSSSANVSIEAHTARAHTQLRNLRAAVLSASRPAVIDADALVSGAIGSLANLRRARNLASGPVNIRADATVAPATNKLDSLNRAADNASRAIFIPATARTQAAQQNLSALGRNVSALNGMSPTIRPVAQTQTARAELAGFNQTIRRYSRSWGSQGIRARVQADTARPRPSYGTSSVYSITSPTLSIGCASRQRSRGRRAS